MFDYKRCPRCNTKMPSMVALCPGCQLNFQKLENATNEEAKDAYSKGEKERVLLVKKLPRDISKAKLLLFTIFLGLFGGHYYYIGRKGMGTLYLIFLFIGAGYTYTQQHLPFNFFVEVWFILTMVWAVIICLWMIDIVKVIFNRFKVPVSLPY